MSVYIRVAVFTIVAIVVFVVLRSRADSSANNKAVQLMNEERYSEAIPILERLRNKKPNDPMVLRNLGAAYEQSTQIEKAYSAYSESLRLNPNQKDVKDQVDALKEKRDLLTKAHERMQRMKNEGLKDEAGVTMDLLQKQAEAHVQMDKHKEAIVLLERILFREPDNIDIEQKIERQEEMLKASK